MNGPRISGEHVMLVPHAPGHAEAFIRFLADTEVTRYLGRREPLGIHQEQDWIRERAEDPNTLGWTLLGAHQRPIGNAGFTIDWRSSHATVGIMIGDKREWGSGRATEVGQLALAYIFGNTSLTKIKASYMAPNLASAKLQAKLGFQEVGRWQADFLREGEWVDHVLTELSRQRWEDLQAA